MICLRIVSIPSVFFSDMNLTSLAAMRCIVYSLRPKTKVSQRGFWGARLLSDSYVQFHVGIHTLSIFKPTRARKTNARRLYGQYLQPCKRCNRGFFSSQYDL